MVSCENLPRVFLTAARSAKTKTFKTDDRIIERKTVLVRLKQFYGNQRGK